MSKIRPTTPHEHAALKAATRRAVDGVGGLTGAEETSRVGKTQIHRYYSADEDGQPPAFIPLDVAADLDRVSVTGPQILRALADLLGCSIKRRTPPKHNNMPWCSEMAALTAEAADVSTAIADGLAGDNQISVAEAQCIVAECREAADQIARVEFRANEIIHGRAGGSDQ